MDDDLEFELDGGGARVIRHVEPGAGGNGVPSSPPRSPRLSTGATDATTAAPSTPIPKTPETSTTPRYIQSKVGEVVRVDGPEPESPEQWQTMDTVGTFEIYNDRNDLVQRIDGLNIDESQNAAAEGYTRVRIDDDARSINSLDERTDHLFDDAEDAQHQIESTKEMLDGDQRLAYVGLCRVVAAARGAQLRAYFPKQHFIDSYLIWERSVMRIIYTHLELSPEEQVMIEQLPAHGVIPSDLTHTLMRTTSNKLADLHTDTGEEGDQHQVVSKATIDVKWTVLCDLFLNLVSQGVYDSRSRYLLEQVGIVLDVSPIEMAQFERKVTDAMQIDDGQQQNWVEDEIIETRRKGALRKKYAYIGAATLGGGLVIGLSAGLLAPVIGAGLAAGFTTIGISGTGTFLAGAGGAAMISSTGAALGAHVGSKGMTRRMGHVKTFEFRPVHNNNRVNVIVSISGWMNGKEDDVRLPYSTVDPLMGDLLSVYWEPEMMQSMGQTINILATEALTQSIQQILGATILTGLMASIQLPMALSKLSYLLDNPWNVSLDRAWNAGLVLADTLRARNLGNRPVTLVGFSLGARVIFSALVELARHNEAGIVQDVYIFGTPLSYSKKQLSSARSIVAGRFVNGYSTKDWVLGYLFRATSGGFSQVLGLSAVKLTGQEDDIVENLDCTDMVEGHMGYRRAMPKLLKRCGWDVLSEEFDEVEDPDPDKLREKQRKLIEELNSNNEDETKKKKKGFASFFGFGSSSSRAAPEWIDAAKQSEPGADQTGTADGVFDAAAIQEELVRLEKMGPQMIFDIDDEIEQQEREKEKHQEPSTPRQQILDHHQPPEARKTPGLDRVVPVIDTTGAAKPYHETRAESAPPKLDEKPKTLEPPIQMSFDDDYL